MTTTPDAAKAKRLANLKGGTRKGVPNKINRDIKEMILEALSHAGGAEYLYMHALDNPKAFLALVGKALPMTVSGDPNNPVGITVNIRQF